MYPKVSRFQESQRKIDSLELWCNMILVNTLPIYWTQMVGIWASTLSRRVRTAQVVPGSEQGGGGEGRGWGEAINGTCSRRAAEPRQQKAWTNNDVTIGLCLPNYFSL